MSFAQRFLLSALAVGLLLGLPAVPNSAAERPSGIAILDVDDYAKTVQPGGSAEFNWTVYRTDSAPVNYTVYINISGAGGGWTAVARPAVIDPLPPLTARTVGVVVTAPPGQQSGQSNMTVTFTVAQDGATIPVSYTHLTLPTIYSV